MVCLCRVEGGVAVNKVSYMQALCESSRSTSLRNTERECCMTTQEFTYAEFRLKEFPNQLMQHGD